MFMFRLMENIMYGKQDKGFGKDGIMVMDIKMGIKNTLRELLINTAGIILSTLF